MPPTEPTRLSHPRHLQLLAVAVLLGLALSGGALCSTVPIYSSEPTPLPPNVPSLGFQATGASEFGDLIQFAGTSKTLASVTVVMSDWALASDYPGFPGASGSAWSHPITLNLYQVNDSGPNPAPGALIATRTQTSVIPWRPPADPTCPGGTAWRAANGSCYSGLAFEVSFDLQGTTVPARIIYGVAFNTQTYGYSPIGAPGPYVSLNLGLAQVPPSIGTNPFPDTAYFNSQSAGQYGDGGAAGVGVFRRDTGWTPYSGAVTFLAQAPDDGAILPALGTRGLAAMALLVAVAGLALLSRGRLAGL